MRPGPSGRLSATWSACWGTDAFGRAFEIGGPDILRYSTMLKRVAEIEYRPLPIIPVPLLNPGSPRGGCRWSPTWAPGPAVPSST